MKRYLLSMAFELICITLKNTFKRKDKNSDKKRDDNFEERI